MEWVHGDFSVSRDLGLPDQPYTPAQNAQSVHKTLQAVLAGIPDAFKASAIMDRNDADVDFLPPGVSGFFVTYSLIFQFLRKSIETFLRFSTNDDCLKRQVRPRHVPPKACLPRKRTLGLV
jgi:hypothetical protein